jgi:hypothetical protein
MRCPKCQFDHPLQTTECLKCGIVFSRYQPVQAQLAKPAETVLPQPVLPPTDSTDGNDATRELLGRAVALPSALLAARLVCATGFRMAAAMLAMVLHETGHAVTAWLTGRWAVPLLWVTPHGEERSGLIVLLLSGAILSGGFLAWKMQKWGWLGVAVAVLLLQLIVLSAPGAGALIIFWGDGGAMVLAMLLMAAFYAPRDTALYRNWGLRCGLLLIGALSFMHVFMVWTGPFEDIPFGEIEGVNLSDPSLLTEMYGWPLPKLLERYILLGQVCLAALLVVYVWGLVSAYLEVRRNSKRKAINGST